MIFENINTKYEICSGGLSARCQLAFFFFLFSFFLPLWVVSCDPRPRPIQMCDWKFDFQSNFKFHLILIPPILYQRCKYFALCRFSTLCAASIEFCQLIIEVISFIKSYRHGSRIFCLPARADSALIPRICSSSSHIWLHFTFLTLVFLLLSRRDKDLPFAQIWGYFWKLFPGNGLCSTDHQIHILRIYTRSWCDRQLHKK